MDIEQTLSELKKRYPEGSPYRTIDDLIAANEDLLEGLVQLRNRSNAMFKMPAELYLKTIGILSANGVRRSSAPEELRRTRMLNRVLDQLEGYYPEHKVFALDSIDSGLRERVSTLTKGMGYSSVDQFLLDQGFELISGEDVKKVRNMVIYSPGNEPAVIQSNIRSMLSRLEEYYPDHIIPRGLQSDHKKLSQSVSGLYQWLGYEDAKAMLEAYGFEYRLGGSGGGAGRPTNDYQPVIDALVEKYRDAAKPTTIAELRAQNPEYSGAIKTMQNSAVDRFGMNLAPYFERLGIIGAFDARRQISTQPNSSEDASDNWRIDRRIRTIEDRRQQMEELTEELQRRYPEGATLPTTLWELRRDNKDLPLSTAESWAKIAFNTTLAVYLRERHLLGDNALATGHRIAREARDTSDVAIEPTAPETRIMTTKQRRAIEDQERLDSVVEELRKRYPDHGSEGSLAELKRKNPDLNIGSLTGPIKRVTGLTPTNYFKKLRYVVSISLWDLGLDYESIWPLQNAGVYFIGDLMKLTPERLNSLSGIGIERRIRIQSVITRCRVLYDVEIDDLGLSNRVLRTLQNNNVFAAIEILNGGQNLSGIGPTSSEEIQQCITKYVQNYYEKTYGNVTLEELGISKRILSALGKHGIVYAYEAVDGCINLAGIGPSSATEIINALSDYIKNKPAVVEGEEQETSEDDVTEPEIDPAVLAAEELAKRTEEAKACFAVFWEQLCARYPEGSEKECLMIHLRQKNADLPFEDAHGWCKLLFDKTLKEYLEEEGLLVAETETDTNEQKYKSPDASSSETYGDTASDVVPVFRIRSNSSPKETNSLVVPDEDVETGEIWVNADFSKEYIDSCVKADADAYESFAGSDDPAIGLNEAPDFIRTLHRLEVTEYLKRTKDTTYAEYLITHGIVPRKPSAYWAEQLLKFLRESFLECTGGMLVYTEPSFEYDPIRKICKISSPLYEGYERISSLQIAEKYSGRLELQPCYCEGNYTFDIALTSNGIMMGQLSKTFFRSVGLGVHIFPLISSKAVTVKNIRLSNEEYPNVIFELHFR